MLKPISIMFLVISMAIMTPCYANQWAITYGGSNRDGFRALWQTLDGGYILSGATYSFGAGSDDQWIVKLNDDGIIEWQKTYGGISSDGQGEITLKDDGGYFLTAETQTFGAGSYDYWIFNLNSDGTIIWQKTLGGAATDWNVPKGQQTADGGFIIEGSTNSFGDGSHDFWVLKLLGNGNIEWQKTYGGSSGDGPSNIQQTSDGGFIIAGGTYSFGAGGMDIWVLRLNSDGTIAWQKTYGGNNNDNASRIRQTSDGGYILVAHTNSFGAGDYDVLVLKLNSNGTIAWQKAYGGINHEYPEIIEQTMDGGFIVGAATHSFGSGGREAWVLKLNANGTIAWQKTYGGIDDDHDGYIHQTLDGGYIMAVPTDSFGAGNMDTLVLKLDENGDIPGCDIIAESSVIVTDTSVMVENTNVVPKDSSAIVTDTNVVPQNSDAELDTICYYSAQLPTVPGFEVQSYANVSQPVSLSFEPSGILYVGNGNWPSKIYRIDVGGSPFKEYGDTPLPDPDAVVFDSIGTISGHPGSVLVGGIDGPNSPTGYLAAILPDESTITIFGPGSGLVNPTDMLFDNGGRLLIADTFAAKVFYSDDGVTLNTLIGNVYLAGELALDENGNIYVSRHMGPISKYSSDGTLLNGSFVTGLDIHGMDFGPSSPPWDGHLFAVSYEGKLYRIDEIGTVTEIGTGFHNPPGDPDLEFGPDGAMYVSDSGNNVIYRIVPKALIKINEFVTFVPDPSTYLFTPDPADCQAGAVGKFSFDATLSNISVKELSDLHVEVDELTNNNLLLNDNGLIGEGERFEVPKFDDYDDGYLSPDKYVDVPFTVCLQEKSPFRFFVNVLGVAEDIDLEKGLVASYPFNGNANDESGNGNDGTVHGIQLINDRFGNPNSAYSFESDQDYISVNTSDISLVGTSFTISAWVRIDNYLVDNPGFIRRGNHANYEIRFCESSKIFFGYSADPPPNYDPNSICGTTDIGLKEWVFVTALYDRDLGMTKLYVNGEFDGNNSNALDPHNPGGPLEIGNWYGTRNSWNYPTFVGDIDDIRIYNRALSAAEIKALFNLGS